MVHSNQVYQIRCCVIVGVFRVLAWCCMWAVKRWYFTAKVRVSRGDDVLYVVAVGAFAGGTVRE